MSYVYRHIRLDTNEVFYVGIGSDNNYQRSRVISHRNKFWKNIINKTEYTIEIMLDNLTWENACNKEKEFIKLYGRRDLNLGTLVNLTDGGDGSLGILSSKKGKPCTEEMRIHLKKIASNRKVSDETKLKLREANLGKKLTSAHKEKLRIVMIKRGRLSSEIIKKAAIKKLKLSKDEFLEIKNLMKNKQLTRKEIAKNFNVSLDVISRIYQGTSSYYKHYIN